MKKILLGVLILLMCGCAMSEPKYPIVEYRMFTTSFQQLPYFYNTRIPEGVYDKINAIENVEVVPTYMISAVFLKKDSESYEDQLGRLSVYRNNEKIYGEEAESLQETNVVGYTEEQLVKTKTEFNYTGNASYDLEGYVTSEVATKLGMKKLINSDFSDEYVIQMDTFIPVKNYDVQAGDLYSSDMDINYLYQPIHIEILVKGILEGSQSQSGVSSSLFSQSEVFVDNDDLLALLKEHQLEELAPVTYLVKTNNPNFEKEVNEIYKLVYLQKLPWEEICLEDLE